MAVTLRWEPAGLVLGDALTRDKAEAADQSRACEARVCFNSHMNHPRCNGLEKSVKPRPLRKLIVKFEVTGNERLTRTFLEGLTDLDTAESSTAREGRMRVNCPAKTVLSNLPLKQGIARVTLHLVVITGNIKIITVASLEDRILRTLVNLERDFVKWMRRELHSDINNRYSPAIRHRRRKLTTFPNKNSQGPDSLPRVQ